MEIPNAYRDPAKGSAVTLPDGTRVGHRFAAKSTGEPALNINIPGEQGELKVHINPRGGVPEIPSTVRPPIAEAPLIPPKPIETPHARGGGSLGGFGVLPDNTLPQLVHPPEAGDPDLPVIGDGIPDHPGQ